MNIKDPIVFSVGAIIGAGISWFFTRQYYKKLSDEEIASVKETFKKLQEDAQKKADIAKNKPDLSIYMDALNKAQEKEALEKAGTTYAINYANFINDQDEDDDGDDIYSVAQPIGKNIDRSRPYLLNRMPYSSEAPYYNIISVMYYADGTYADPHGSEIEIIDYIGEDMMGYVEETNKDEIFIRNDELELDIDIVKDARTYDEVMFG